MNTQQAMESADFVQRVQKGTPVADKYLSDFETGRAFVYYDRHSPEVKNVVKIIHGALGFPGEFNFFLKKVV